MLGADITVKVIIKFCTFRKMDKMYMLILVTFKTLSTCHTRIIHFFYSVHSTIIAIQFRVSVDPILPLDVQLLLLICSTLTTATTTTTAVRTTVCSAYIGDPASI